MGSAETDLLPAHLFGGAQAQACPCSKQAKLQKKKKGNKQAAKPTLSNKQMYCDANAMTAACRHVTVVQSGVMPAHAKRDGSWISPLRPSSLHSLADCLRVVT